MKKRLYILLILVIAFIIAMPAAVFATTPPPANATRGSLVVEYRYMEGQTPYIPTEITRFGFRFYLVSQSAPIYAGDLPAERTEYFTIDGLMSKAQLAMFEADLAAQGLKARIEAVPEMIDLRIEMDKEEQIIDGHPDSPLATNDVEDLPRGAKFFDDQYVLDYLFGNNPAGKVLVTGVSGRSDILDINVPVAPFDAKDRAGKDISVVNNPNVVGVEFDVRGPDGDGLPSGYDATVVYRGVVQFSVEGYSNVQIVYSTDDEDLVNTWIIRAVYESDELPFFPIEVIDIGEGAVPLDAGEGGLTPVEQAQVDNQTGNIIDDIADGNVPLGNPGVTGTWSLISLILSVAALVIIAIHAIGLVARRKREEEKEQEEYGVDHEKLALIEKRASLYRVLTIIVGAITIVTWLFLDNLTLGVSWINAYTPIVGVLCGVTIVLLVFTKVQDNKAKHDGEETQEDETNVA